VRTRLISAIVLLPIVLALLAQGGVAWAAFVAVAAALAAREYCALARAGGRRPVTVIAVVTAPLLALTALWPESDLVRPVVAGAVVAAFLAQVARPAPDRSAGDWAATLAGPIFVGALAGYTVLLRGLGASGVAWTALLLVMVWANDSAAYAVGKSLGRTPLAPVLSPRKTREGALAGGAASVAVGLLTPAAAAAGPGALASLASQPPLALAALGVAVSVAAPLGDLSKSFLKRHAGVKDAGALIPGHGGVLDRADSLLFAAPVVYYAARLLGG
jgi:phosphatidate cytidylyltransferase